MNKHTVILSVLCKLSKISAPAPLSNPDDFSCSFVTRRGKELCVATDLPRLSAVMRHVDYLKKFCKEKNYRVLLSSVKLVCCV